MAAKKSNDISSNCVLRGRASRKVTYPELKTDIQKLLDTLDGGGTGRGGYRAGAAICGRGSGG